VCAALAEGALALLHSALQRVPALRNEVGYRINAATRGRRMKSLHWTIQESRSAERRGHNGAARRAYCESLGAAGAAENCVSRRPQKFAPPLIGYARRCLTGSGPMCQARVASTSLPEAAHSASNRSHEAPHR
jgi:hypothetical protein